MWEFCTCRYRKAGRVDVGGVVTGKNIMIATGSVPFVPPGIPIDGKTVFTSDHALKLEWIPDWVAIVGSGYIGLEFSDVYTALGSEVTFVEAMPNIMPGFDPEIAKLVRDWLFAFTTFPRCIPFCWHRTASWAQALQDCLVSTLQHCNPLLAWKVPCRQARRARLQYILCPPSTTPAAPWSTASSVLAWYQCSHNRVVAISGGRYSKHAVSCGLVWSCCVSMIRSQARVDVVCRQRGPSSTLDRSTFTPTFLPPR